MHSIWHEGVTRLERPILEGEHRTDVLVIGGGMAGILCAHRLQRAGVRCIVLEADVLGGGVTGSTTAKLSAGHGLLYAELLHRFGREHAQLYWLAQRRAIRAYDRLSREHPCDLQKTRGFVYVQEDRRALEREQRALEQIGADTSLVDALPLPMATAGAVCYPHEAQIHPLRLLYSLAKELTVFEHSRVVDLTPNRAITQKGAVTASRIVVATHFPFLNKHGAYFLKQYQYRSYVTALKNAAQYDGMYVDGMGKAPSFRNYGGWLLLGGGGHRTGKRGKGWRVLEGFAALHYPRAKEVARWATQDCMTLDRIPYVGQYGRRTPTLFVATGFNKWGMTGAMSAAMLLEDLILERKTIFSDLFSPTRTLLHPQLGINAFEAVTGLLFPARRRCPHLGCALKWNAAEHSWDCPCHGSRFDTEGHVLNNPANGDLKQ